MRKFLVKNFALDYRVKLFGRQYGAPRASRIIFPVFVATGIANCYNDNYPTPTALIWFLYALTVLVLFFGFVYFRFRPIKFNELDDLQKLQYGYYPLSKMTAEERKEWLKIKKRYE